MQQLRFSFITVRRTAAARFHGRRRSRSYELEFHLLADSELTFTERVYGTAAALRLLPRTIPSVAELGLPESLEELTRHSRGLILVTGPTGCGKSTTLVRY